MASDPIAARARVDLRHVAAALLACVQGSYNLARATMQVSKMSHSLGGAISLLRSLQSPLLPAARKRKPHARKSAKEFAEASPSRTRLRRRRKSRVQRLHLQLHQAPIPAHLVRRP